MANFNSTFHTHWRKQQTLHETLFLSGDIVPFRYPHGFAFILIVVVPLLIPQQQRTWVLYLRRLAFICACFLMSQIIRHCRLSSGSNLVVGIWGAYSAIWSGVFLVFKDFEKCYMRVEEQANMIPVQEENGIEMSDGSLATTNPGESTEGDMQRHQLGAQELSSKLPASNGSPLSHDVCVLRWQGYPDTLLRRFFWVLDMLLSLKGAGWNWGLQTPLIPTSRRLGPQDIRQHDRSLVQIAISSMLIALVLYIQMLLLQTIALTDPYFWGFVSSNLGSERRFGPAFLTQSYRACMSAAMIWTSMSLITSSLQLVHALIAILMRSFGCKKGWTLQSSWLFAYFLQDTHSLMFIPKTRIEWFWGAFWHQTYRHGLVEASLFLSSPLTKRLSSTARKYTVRFLVFTLSGVIHWCGLFTSFMPLNNPPSLKPIVFFAIQPVGILIQRALMDSLRSVGFANYVCMVIDYSAAFLWLVVTSPMLLDELARTGTWALDVPGPWEFLHMVGFRFG